MSTEPTDTPTEVTPESPPVDPAPIVDDGERTFTQEEVGRIIAQERKRARETAQKEAADQKAASSKGPRKSAADKELADRIAELERRQEFTLVAADYALPKTQVLRLQDMYIATGGEDADAWLKSMVDTFGLQEPKPRAEPPGDPPPAPTPTGPPASDRGGPRPEPDTSRFDNPLRWDASAVARIRESEDNYWAGVRAVKKRFMEGLRGVQIVSAPHKR